MPSRPATRTRHAPFAGALLLLALLAAALAAPGNASAHRVNIFAWLEGDSILVECGFNRSSPVREGLVTVFDATDGKELLQGRTDATGLFRFPVPGTVRQGHGLRIEVNAGEGHVNDWTMTAAEINEARDLSHGFHEAPPAQAVQAPRAAVPPLVTPGAPAAVPARAPGTGVTPALARDDAPPAPQRAVNAQEVRAIVAEALAGALAPLRRELAAMSSPGPSLRDIIGGLGWIMGLVGIACLFLARRKQHKP